MAEKDKTDINIADDHSPNGLELPKPGKSQSKKKFNIILLVLVGMGLIVLNSFFDSGDDKKKKKEEAAKEETVETRTYLGGEDAGRGLAQAKFPKPPAPENNGVVALPPPMDAGKKGDDKIKYVGPPVKNEVDEAQKMEALEERRKKREAYCSGLSANIMVFRGNPNPGGQTEAEARNARGQGQSQSPALAASSPDGYDPAADRDKEAFFERADNKQWISPYTREAGRQFEMKTGTVIPAIMVTGINSDLPGQIIAQVSQNVFNTADGKYLLVPQGSKLFGAYDSRVIYGQERVLVAWNRLVFPDGSSVTLGAMPGADMAGYAGFNDQVDNHYLRIFGSAVLMSLITGGMSYSMDNNSNQNSDANATTVQDSLSAALAAQMGQTTMKMLEKNLNIKPTLGIRPGYAFNVLVTKDVVFGRPYAAQ